MVEAAKISQSGVNGEQKVRKMMLSERRKKEMRLGVRCGETGIAKIRDGFSGRDISVMGWESPVLGAIFEFL